MGLGHVFGGNAHVVLVVDVPQAVHDHGVHHIPVAHALALAAAQQHVGRGAHVFLAAGDHDFAVAIGHGLGGQHHGLKTGAAHRVDGERRGFFGHATLDERLARRVLARACRQHLAHDDFTNLVGAQPGALQQVFDDRSTQLRRRHFGQAAAKFAHRSAGGGNDNDVFHEIAPKVLQDKDKNSNDA